MFSFFIYYTNVCLQIDTCMDWNHNSDYTVGSQGEVTMGMAATTKTGLGTVAVPSNVW